MKEYKITYTYNAENGTHDYFNIVERSEVAARRGFKAHHKDGTILGIEIVAEDAPATKQQEREALETIRKIVGELGPNSYVGTAFDGCFQVAVDNIENDCALSIKQRLENKEFTEEKLRGELAEAARRIEELGSMVGSLKDERDALVYQLTETTLTEEVLYDIRVLAAEESCNAQKRLEENAERMAINAEYPETVAFTEAVKEYRKAKKIRDRCERILAEVDKREGAADEKNKEGQ